jgi:hypothetical protein
MADEKPTLDYGTTPRSDTLAGCLGVAIGVLAVPMFLGGAIGIVAVFVNDVLRHRGGVNTGADFFEVIVIFVIGLFMALVAVRWMRGARRGPENRQK